jgi:hypothetical protein
MRLGIILAHYFIETEQAQSPSIRVKPTRPNVVACTVVWLSQALVCPMAVTWLDQALTLSVVQFMARCLARLW